MAHQISTVPFEKMLMKFVSDDDPMLSMLKWLCERLMEAEVESKLGAEKSERSEGRQGYRSGYRIRRFDTRMGTMYLMVPKITKTLGIESISRGQVSVITKELNKQVEEFRQRKLENTYPVLWVDALYEPVTTVRLKIWPCWC